MQKWIFAFATVAGLLIVGYFVKGIMPGPCDGIFEQTAPSLTVKVNALKANGGWAIGPEKVQDVAEGAQKIALHLKSCCISQQSGNMKPEQYQVCVNGAKDYEAKIIQITNIVGEAQAAKQDGKNEVVDQKVKEARTAAAESTSIVSNIAGVLASAEFLADPSLRCDLLEAKRVSGGILMIRWRIVNTSSPGGDGLTPTAGKSIRYDWDWGNFFYIDPAQNKKYLTLTDSSGTHIGVVPDVTLQPGASWQMWAKFAGPPATSNKISVTIAGFPPFEDVQVSQ
jgi:hypothetical protein